MMQIPYLILLGLLLSGVESKQVCTQSEKLDMQILVDASGSVGEENFNTMMKKIADDLIGRMKIGKNKARVALMTYDHEVRDQFDLDRYLNKAKLQAAIKSFKFTDGATNTAKAMREALENFKRKERKGDSVAKVCLVFTDGTSSDRAELPGVTAEYKKSKITIFAIGIKNGIDKKALAEISGAKERVIQFQNFDDIGTKAESLLETVCRIVGPTCRGNVNLAIGGKATASSVWSNSGDGSFAFAGPSRQWHSKTGMPQWVQYELVQPAVVCKVSFLPRMTRMPRVTADCPRSYKIEGSNDGSNFHTLLSVKGQTCPIKARITQTVNNQRAFKFYRFTVVDVLGRKNGNKFGVIRDLKFFG